MPRTKPGTGEKPKIMPRERYPSGQPKPVDDGNDSAVAPTLLKRLKDHVMPRAKDKRLGTVLGLMHLEGIITETECEAGFLYAEDVGAYERVMGHPRRSAKSVSFDSGYGRADVDMEALEKMDPEAAKRLKDKNARRKLKVKKRYEKVQACIPGPRQEDFARPDEFVGIQDGTKTGRLSVSLRGSIMLSALIEEVCCNDRPIHSAHHATLKALLGRLARDCYRLYDGEPERRQRRQDHRDKNADVAHLAQGAVEAMESWFRRNGATLTCYRVQKRHESQARAITGYGMSRDKKAIENTIRIKRPTGIKGALIDAVLAAKADAKGWTAAAVTEQEVA